MKRKLLLPTGALLVLIAISISSFEDSDKELFYYAFNEKIYLKKSPNEMVIRYASPVKAKAHTAALQQQKTMREIEWKDDRTAVITFTGTQAMEQEQKEITAKGDIVSLQPMYKTEREDIDMGVTDEILVRFKKEATKEAIMKLLGTYRLKVSSNGELFQTLSVPAESNALQIANEIQESGLAEFSHPDFYAEIQMHQVPNDTYFPFQFNLHNTGQVINDGHVGTVDADIDAPEAWTKTQGSNSIVIAVIDEGVTDAHPDLPTSRQVRLNGSNFSNPALPNDPSAVTNGNHGNACAGIIAATRNNSQGIAGIAPNCKIMPIKVFNPTASSANFANAITFAKNNGAHIISNSWGYNSSNPNLIPAIVTAIQGAVTTGRGGLGCVVVFAAGNTANHVASNNGYVGFPGNVNIPGVLTVGASDRNDLQSNYSPTSNPASPQNQIVDIVAPSHRAYPSQIPGETFEIWSIDIPTAAGYNSWHGASGFPPFGEILPNFGVNNLSYTGRMGGTSAACPEVAGGAALLLSVNPALTHLQVFNILTQTADKVGGVAYNGSGFSNAMGFGRLNLFRAVTLAGADLFMKDQPTDAGLEANPDNASPYYASQDIWVRNALDGGLTHQNPEYGTTNYVYVRVRNRGFLGSSGVSDRLKVYWAKASGALSWTYPWLGANDLCGSNIVPVGGAIGSPQVIPAIPSGNSTILVFPWAPPKPNDYTPCFGADASHFCLLARIETNISSPFGMTFPETSSLWNNVKNNNNIVWKNISVVDLFPNFVGPVRTSILLAGSELTRRKYRTLDLQFVIPQEEQNGNILEVAKVDIDLNRFTERWLANGGKVRGGEIIKDDEGRILIRIFNKEATIFGIPIEPKELNSITAAVTATDFPAGKNFDFDLQTTDEQTPLGGERFTVRFNEKEKEVKQLQSPPVQAKATNNQITNSENSTPNQLLKIAKRGAALSVSLFDGNNYQADLMDAGGKLLKSQRFINSTEVPVAGYSNGVYLLRITNIKTKQVRTEKIVL